MKRPDEPPFEIPVTPKELAFYLPNRSARWVRARCKSGNIKTLDIGRPYLIPHYEANRILGIHDGECADSKR